MAKSANLFTRPFIIYCSVMFLTFCNMAVFFQFNSYLKTLALDPAWNGFIIGVFSLTVLICRPIISPFLHEYNSRLWIILSAIGIILCLALYNFGSTILSISLIRIFHGLAYTIMATASLSGIVSVIPDNKSSQAFALVSVLTLLPFAVVPPIVGPLTEILGGFDVVLDLFGLAMFLIFPLILFGIPAPDGSTRPEAHKIRWEDFVYNIKQTRIVFILLASLLVWTSFTIVFYYIKGFGDSMKIGNPGWFFALSTFSEIGVRLVGGPFMDRMNKSKTLAITLIWLSVMYLGLSYANGATLFFLMGITLGLGWGLTMPILSGLVFDISEPKFRALNSNLSMEMFQGGYFLGPLIGGSILLHLGYSALFIAAAVLTIGAFLLTIPLIRTVGDNGSMRS